MVLSEDWHSKRLSFREARQMVIDAEGENLNDFTLDEY